MTSDVATRSARRRLERSHRDLQDGLEMGPAGWIARRFVSGSALGVLATMGLTALETGLREALDPSSPGFLLRLMAPVALAAVASPILYLRARKRARMTVDDLLAESDSEVADMTRPGWVGRTVRQGLLLAAGVGVPVGSAMALLFPTTELPGESRILAFVGFLLMTAAWALPFVFLVRWMSLNSQKRLRDPAEGL